MNREKWLFWGVQRCRHLVSAAVFICSHAGSVLSSVGLFLQSVQPDAASPTHVSLFVSPFSFWIKHQSFWKRIHSWFCWITLSSVAAEDHVCVRFQGHNQLVAYSRAAYFCIFCSLIWLLEQLLRRKDLPVSTLYGVTIVCYDVLHFFRDLLVGRKEATADPFQTVRVACNPLISCVSCFMHQTGFTYCFPVAFLVGLFPQINTFTIYLLEQIDMQFFGGTGS